MQEEKIFDGDKIKAFVTRNAGYIMAFLVAVAYIATSLITIDETGKSVIKIIGEGAIAFCVGMFFTAIFSLQGIMQGHNDPRVIDAHKKHHNKVMEVAPCVDKLDEWCEKKTAEALKKERTRILASCSMRYVDYFDEDGLAKPYEEKVTDAKQAKARRRCYEKAVRCKITPLTANMLTGGRSRTQDPFNFGPDIDEYEKTTLKRDAISKVGLGVIFGYYTVSFLMGLSVSDLIWKIFQVCLFCGSGIIQKQKSFLFMTDGFCKRLFQLTAKLCEFWAEVGGENEKAEEV